MAIVTVVPKEDWDVVSRYLAPGIVLVPEDVYNKLPEQDKQIIDGCVKKDSVDYDFGGDADYWVDVLTDSDSFAMNLLRGDEPV